MGGVWGDSQEKASHWLEGLLRAGCHWSWDREGKGDQGVCWIWGDYGKAV